jgi:phosphatidylserine decarboxylase
MMKRFRYFAATGIRWILLSVVASSFFWLQFDFTVALPAIVLTLLLMRFYYDPERDLPSYPLGVMSPVDGRVLQTDIVHDPFVGRTAQRIRIKSDVLGVYHGRSPIEGKMIEFWPALTEDREQYSKADTKGVLWIETDEGDDVVLIAISNSVWARTWCDIRAGERAGQARRCGRFPPGSVIDILLDDNSYIETTPGQRVKAGVDRVASFNHEQLNEVNNIESDS